MRRHLLPALLAPVVALAVLATSSVALADTVVAPAASTSVTPDDTVQSAQAEVAALSAEVDRTAAELTEGTTRLEAGQARLAATQAQAQAARTAADLALAAAAAAKALLARMVNAAYRTPRPDSVTLALGAEPGRLEEAVLADAALDHIRGNEQDALHEATRRGEEAKDLVAQADALEAQATTETADLQAQVAALTATATATRDRLEAAAQRLAEAQAAQAAAAAADLAARQAASAAGLVDASGGGALCTGVSTAGYPNGFLPAQALCPLAVGGGHRLRADAAAAFNRMYADHAICVTDSYRSYAAQVDVYARKPGLAAIPGTSNHGLGLAVDLCNGVQTFGSPEYDWMKANAGRYGFVHPAWAEPGGSRPEPWHWEFAG